MKGEVFQLCSIVTSAKNALHTKTFIQYEPVGYELSTQFQFIPEAEGEKGEIAEDVEAWYARCVYNGMNDIKLLAPTAVKDRKILGFINTSQSVMLCFYPNDEIHMWMPRWFLDKEKHGWHIVYKETLLKEHPAGKPMYKDNSPEFREALENIKNFASELGLAGWANVFERSISMLDGGFDYDADYERMRDEFKKKGRPMPPKKRLALPEHNRDVFEAAANADVFGAMGSWNDSPAAIAGNAGRDKEYNELSNKLYMHIAIATMYAINQW
ncbi:MAG: hypothetical protein ACI4R6_08195 [Lachnospiraceae bacterium]